MKNCLSVDRPKAYFDFCLWVNGSFCERINNFRKRPREISKIIETVNISTQVNKKIVIKLFKSSADTLGCEVLNKSVNEKEFISKEKIKINYVEKRMENTFRNKLIVTFLYNSPMNPKIKKVRFFISIKKP